jgi:hypothetical protein
LILLNLSKRGGSDNFGLNEFVLLHFLTLEVCIKRREVRTIHKFFSLLQGSPSFFSRLAGRHLFIEVLALTGVLARDVAT